MIIFVLAIIVLLNDFLGKRIDLIMSNIINFKSLVNKYIILDRFRLSTTLLTSKFRECNKWLKYKPKYSWFFQVNFTCFFIKYVIILTLNLET